MTQQLQKNRRLRFLCRSRLDTLRCRGGGDDDALHLTRPSHHHHLISLLLRILLSALLVRVLVVVFAEPPDEFKHLLLLRIIVRVLLRFLFDGRLVPRRLPYIHPSLSAQSRRCRRQRFLRSLVPVVVHDDFRSRNKPTRSKERDEISPIRIIVIIIIIIIVSFLSIKSQNVQRKRFLSVVKPREEDAFHFRFLVQFCSR